jgi:tRNA pseudouridine13 synthase
VEELPLYQPGGIGEHLYLWVEKRELSTPALLEQLSRATSVPLKEIGVAGRKDARAVTRQWVSLRTLRDPPDGSLDGEVYRILQTARHGNKLRPGHLLGNRFVITIRDVAPAFEPAALLERLEREGFPNYFGSQRFGPAHRNTLQGRSLVRGERPLRGALDQLRFAVNAYQSALFNALVAVRLAELGELGRMLAGDLAVLHHNGAHFSVDEEGLAEAQTRSDLHEISPSAPLFGYKIPLAAGRAGEWERALLAEEGLSPERFRLGSQRVSPKGERRAVRAFPHALACEAGADTGGRWLRLSFSLDRGVYATALLREVMKSDGPEGQFAEEADTDSPST